MTADPKGRGLFIVDNSISGWTGLRYLEEWAGIAKAFDIVTGYFEIGALLALDGQWQALDHIRILMGAETTYRTRTALLDAVRGCAVQILDGSLEENKGTNPFLHGVPAILDALRSGQIECRVYDKDKFHAKAYITHAKLEVVGSQALVGSSNFTALDALVVPSVPGERGAPATERSGVQPGQPLAQTRSAAADQALVAHQSPAAAGENRGPAGEACQVLLAPAGGRTSDPAVVRRHVAADLGAAGAGRLTRGPCDAATWRPNGNTLGAVSAERPERRAFSGSHGRPR